MDYRELAREMLESMAFQKMPTEKHSQMSSGERGILSYLHYYQDGVLAGDLSRDMGVTTGRIAVALKSLEKKGLIERCTDERDRRCVIVHITPEGVRVVEALYSSVLDSMEQMLIQLGEQDAKEYVRIIKRIAQMSAKEKTEA